MNKIWMNLLIIRHNVVFMFVLQVCENQQNDLQLLQLNLESAHETLREKTSRGVAGRWMMYKENMAEK